MKRKAHFSGIGKALSHTFAIATIVAALVGCSSNGSGGDGGTIEVTKLFDRDGVEEDLFGTSVSISGDYAIVGAEYDDDRGEDAGSAFVFERIEGGWRQVRKLTASDGSADAFFGTSVSISGDYAIVGANGDDVNGRNQGSAYIFRRVDSGWSLAQKVTANGGASEEYFGASVAISGDYAIVGALGDDDNGAYAGAAYVFEHTENGWSQVQKLTAADGTAWDEFGASVAISGDYAIVGALGDEDGGSAYIFERSGSGWSQVLKLTASDRASGDYFGASVAISGDYAIVGAWGDDDRGDASGSAYIFERSGSGWSQVQKLTASDGASDDSFGWSVAISGDNAIVGARDDDDDNPEDYARDSGSAYVFERTADGWSQVQKLTARDRAADDRFGDSVAISADQAIIGSSHDDVTAPDSGSAYIWRYR